MRLVSMLALGLMAGCAYLFVARRCTVLYAFLAMLFPFATGAFLYAYEARPYALMMAGCGAAMLCWQRAAEEPRPTWALLGLAASLALAVSFHYYAVFLFLPILMGEAVRCVGRKRLDLPLMAALGCALLPLVLWVPLALRGGRQLAGCGTWGVPVSLSLWAIRSGYGTILEDTSVLLAPLVVLLGMVVVLGEKTEGDAPAGTRQRPPAHEWAAILALTCLPVAVCAVTFAAGLPNGQLGRYSLGFTVGMGILLAFLTSAGSRQARDFAAAAVVVLLASLGVHQLHGVQMIFASPKPILDASLQSVLRQRPALPLVFSDAGTALSIWSNPIPETSSRGVVLHSVDAHGSGMRCLETLAPFAPVAFRGYDDFVRFNPDFLLWVTPLARAYGSLIPRLVRDGHALHPLIYADGDELYLVTTPP